MKYLTLQMIKHYRQFRFINFKISKVSRNPVFPIVQDLVNVGLIQTVKAVLISPCQLGPFRQLRKIRRHVLNDLTVVDLSFRLRGPTAD